MVATRASSRESTPAMSVRARTTTRRSTTAPVDVAGTPRTTRARKTGPQATARSGHTSHAYGVGSQATASRVASRNLGGFASALENELVEQETFAPEPDLEPKESTFLPPVIEEERRSVSRESTPASKVSSSFSNSPSALLPADYSKSFSRQREGGLRDTPVSHFRDMPPPAIIRPVPPPEPQGPTISERISAAASDLVAGAKLFLDEYWQLLLGLLLALTLGSLLAIYGFPSIPRILPERVLPNPDYPASGQPSVVTSYITAPSSDPAVSNRLRHLESRLTHLEDELSRSLAISTPLKPPFNHISASIGATILPGLTSPTKRTVSALLSPFAKLWTPPGMKGPLTALMPWTEPGQCWCAPSERAALAVRAPYEVRAAAVTLEHLISDEVAGSGHDLETAPSVVELWARATADPEDLEINGCESDVPVKGFVCLGRLRLKPAPGLVRSWTMELPVRDVVSSDFVFVVLENRGSVAATCLYRVQLHGEKV